MGSLFPDQDLQQLIADARRGQKDALGEICNGLMPVVARMCQTLFPEYLTAKVGESDLVQEALLGASQNFASFQGNREADLLAWVQVIVENKSLDLKRRYLGSEMRDISREQPLVQLGSSRLDILLTDSTDLPLDRLINEEETARIQKLVLNLPSHYQEIVQLRHRDGLTFLEIASRLGRTEPSVKNIYVRALELLERGLSE